MATPLRPLVIPEVIGPVDLVILITPKSSDEDYNELRFVLRTFEKNFPRRGRVYVLGLGAPPWLKMDEVVYLPIEDRPGWKDFNIINKVNIACASGVSRHFIFCSDDQFVLRPSVPADFWPREEGHVTDWNEEVWQKKLARKKIWYSRLRHTAEVLQKRGKDVYNFDSHHPVLMDRELFPKIMAEYGIADPKEAGKHGFVINSLYFNAIDAMPLRARDLHRTTGTLPPPNARFWNVNMHEHWPQALGYLRARYPARSSFETRSEVSADDTLSLVLKFIADREIKSVCEFGSGESTAAFLKAGCKVVTFETSEGKLDRVAEENGEPEELEGVVYAYPEIPVERMSGELVYVSGPVGKKSNGREMPIAKAAELQFNYIAVHDSHRTGEAANIRKYLGAYEVVGEGAKVQIFRRRAMSREGIVAA